MHSLSIGSGVAIARLLDRPTAHFVKQAATVVERARVGLVMGPSELTAAMMFAQPLVKAWPQQWVFAYLIGVDLGMKYLQDGFFISDIVSFVTDGFSVQQLKQGERQAFGMVECGNFHKRFFSSRNALASLAVEFPMEVPQSDQLPLNLVVGEEDSSLHVLVVSCAETMSDWCADVRAANSDAIVTTCSSLVDAVRLMHQYYRAGTRVSIICVDSVLLAQNMHAADDPASTEIFARSHRFCQQLEPTEGLSFFACKPYVVVISTAVEEAAFSFSKEGGSACDCILPAHLTSKLLPTIMDIGAL
ncbi:hypothetical protein AB1Y20_014032 [Prymnesium parvum]|uniref:Uncharacterized protein n=1 Tax=Prymnesium parvum TaxID=97485 RepID=A0AB34II58_PRYPA